MSPSRLWSQSWVSFFLFSLVLLIACGDAADKRNDDTPNNDGQTDTADGPDGSEDDADTDDGEVEDKEVTFTTPVKKADPTTDGKYKFQFAFAEQPEGTTWSLFWSKTEGATADGTVVLSEQAMTVTEYVWAMGGLDQGEYFFYIELKFVNGGTTVHPAPGSVQYTEGGATSNVSPQLDVDEDFAKGNVLVNTTDTDVTIPYSVFDADGDTPTIKIALSSDGGVTYDIVLSDDAPTNGYTWDVADSGVAKGVYHIRITADDGISLADEETSSAPIVVNDGTDYTYTGHVKSILDSYCNECHSGGANNFDSDEYGNGVDDTKAGAKAINISSRAVDFETMPPQDAMNPAPLPAADQLILKAWYLQGAAN